MPTLFHRNLNFNAHHSPMGAYFTFTCGHFGTRGGLGVQLGKPANQDLFIGIKDGDRYNAVPLQVLPFFDGADKLDPAAAYTQQSTGDPQRFAPYTHSQITREYGHSTDRWKTPDFEFSLYTPFTQIPDPATASSDDLRDALLPAITAELILDNRRGTHTKTGFFAVTFNDGGARILDEGLSPHRVGFAFRSNLGVIAELIDMPDQGNATAGDAPPPQLFPFQRWWPHEGLEDRSNPIHLLGTTPGIGFEVPPGKRYSLRLALGCHLPEIVTTRLEGRYFYNRYYPNLLAVLNAAADRFRDLKRAAKTQDEKLAASGLSPDQQFLIAHASRSYYANTELLEIEAGGGEPYWIVNEGEYCMMNTLDLAVDQVFWELDQNPWVVKNLLDNFVKRYSYVDEVKIPDDLDKTILRGNAGTGGMSFTHDQGTHNQFSPFYTSAYEQKNLTGCFSYMTQEQLCNWILIAASYVATTNDAKWLKGNYEVIKACLYSMTARRTDEGDMMAFDSARCGTGREITTYDSLDPSLGAARDNLYLGVKCWAAYHGLRLLDISMHPDAGGLDVESIASHEIESLGRIIEGRMLMDIESHRVLPVIEAMVFARYWHLSKSGGKIFDNLRDFGVLEMPHLLDTMRKHLITLLSDPDHRNKFPDGGIKLSSTSDNSWLSKIAIVQHVARTVFHLDENGHELPIRAATVRERPCDEEEKSLSNGRGSDTAQSIPRAAGWEKSDGAHVTWLTTGPGAYWCASDQIVNGSARGSRYYPRLITTALWLTE